MNEVTTPEFYKDILIEDTNVLYDFSIMRHIESNVRDIIKNTIKFYTESDEYIKTSIEQHYIRFINLVKYIDSQPNIRIFTSIRSIRNIIGIDLQLCQYSILLEMPNNNFKRIQIDVKNENIYSHPFITRTTLIPSKEIAKIKLKGD